MINDTIIETGYQKMMDHSIRLKPEEASKLKLGLEELKKNCEIYKETPVPFDQLALYYINRDTMNRALFPMDQALAHTKARVDFLKTNTDNLSIFDDYKNSTRYFLLNSKSYNDYTKKIDEAVSESTEKSYKPLGELGEITFNQAFLKGSEIFSPLYNLYSNYSTEILYGTTGFTSYFMYKRVVNLYSSVSVKNYNLNIVEDKVRRTKDIRNFMLFSAPFIVSVLYGISSLFQTSVIISKPSVISDEIGSSSKSIFPFIGSFLKKLPDWLKVLLVTYSLYFLFHYLYPEFFAGKSSFFLIRDILISYPYYAKLFFTIGIVIHIYFIIKYMLMIYFFIMFSKGKMEMPIYLPITTLNWLNYIKGATSRFEKGVFIEIYIKYIVIYLFLIFLYSFMIYIL